MNQCLIVSKVSFIEINLREKSGFLLVHITPNRNNVINHMKNISTGLDQFSATYDNLNLMEDFNVEPEETNMSEPEKNPFETKNMV